MRIIKEGRKPRYEWIVECGRDSMYDADRGCGCEFAYDENDVHTMKGDRAYEPDWKYVVCPCCGRQISFGKGKKVRVE